MLRPSHSRARRCPTARSTNDAALTDRIIIRGRAIQALDTIEPSGPLERAAARRLLYACKRRLRGVVEIAPSWMVEEILSASERVGDRGAVVWISEN